MKRFVIVPLLGIALNAYAAELVTDEFLRLQVLRLIFPLGHISASSSGADWLYTTDWLKELPLQSALKDENRYSVVGPIAKDEEEASRDILMSSDLQRFSTERIVLLRLYRWRLTTTGDPILIAVLNYSFPKANPSRCCRAVGKVLLLSNSADHVLDSVSEMPNAFTTFTQIQFVGTRGNGSEKLLVSANFAGAATVGVNTVVFDLSKHLLTPLLWLTTAVYSGFEKEEMYTMTLDTGRTLSARGRRFFFVTKTYIKNGKKFVHPQVRHESYSIKGAVPLDWL